MDIVTTEQALVAYFASELSLIADSTIFRGSLPPSITNGLGIILDQVSNGNEPASGIITAQIIGRYTDRDTALELMEAFDSLLPVYGVTQTMDDTEVVLTIVKNSHPACYMVSHQGREITELTANIKILTKHHEVTTEA